MKNRFTVLFLCVFIILALCGCTLARPDDGYKSADSGRLIGALVTTEPLDLFDDEGFINDHLDRLISGGDISVSDTSAYQGRLYAVLKDRKLTDSDTGKASVIQEYVFDTVNGVSYFAASTPQADGSFITVSSSDNRISGGHLSINAGDTGDSVSLEGTIYICPSMCGKVFYINPVYQDVSGVYAVSGSGYSQSGDSVPGSTYTTTLSSSSTSAVNGEQSSAISGEVKLSISVMLSPAKIAVLQFGDGGEPVSRNEYAPGELPGTIEAEQGVEYIIVETRGEDSSVISRELYDESVGTDGITTYYEDSEGYIEAQHTELVWES